MENIEEKTQEQKEILQHIKKKKYIKAEEIVKANPSLFDFYINNMGTNQHAKRASEFIIKQGRNLQDFPPIVERLQKKAVRYQIANYDWELVGEKLASDKPLLAIAAEDYFYKKNLDIAYTLITHYQLGSYLQKKEINDWIKQIEVGELVPPSFLDNKLIDNDKFQPTFEDKEGSNYVKLSEYGILEPDVHIIRDLQALEFYKDEILASKKVQNLSKF